MCKSKEMGEERYNLTWNNFSDHLRSMLLDMMEMNYLTDVTIVCDDQKIIKAHKFILSACSPVFKTIIDNVSHETAVIYLRGIKFEEMEALLEFMYKGQVTLDQNKINEFITVAKNLQMRELDHLQTGFTVTEDNIDDENEKVNAGQIIQEVKQEQTTKPFKYDHCNFESKSLAMVNQVRRYGCTLCEKEFTRQSGLRDHVNLIHNGIKNHQCNICSYKTAKKGNLKVHVLSVHCEGENRFKCSACDYSTMIHSNLKVHTNKHHH